MHIIPTNQVIMVIGIEKDQRVDINKFDSAHRILINFNIAIFGAKIKSIN